MASLTRFRWPLCAIAIIPILCGCATSETPPLPTSTSLPSPAIPTPMASPPSPALPPSATSPTLVKSLDELAGVWEPLSDNPDAMFLEILLDGVCRQSFTREGLAAEPQAESTCAFEGDILVFSNSKLSGVPPCPSPTAGYEVRAMAGDQIQLVAVKESCSRRRNSTQYLYQRLP